MTLFDITGYIAAFLTTISFVPQVIKTFHDGHTKGISLQMYTFFSIGILAWLIYGIGLGQLPVILANGVTFVLATVVLTKKIINVRKGED